MERVINSEHNHVVALRLFPKELGDSPLQFPLRIQLPQHRLSSPTPLNFSTTHVLYLPELMQAPGTAGPRRKLALHPIAVEKSHTVSPSMTPYCSTPRPGALARQFDIKPVPCFSHSFTTRVTKTNCTEATATDQQQTWKASVLIMNPELCRHGRVDVRAFPGVLTRFFRNAKKDF